MGTKLIIIGGYLGAGKTTALNKLGQILSEKNHIVGFITNDQASELVDTAILRRNGKLTSEVSGKSFSSDFKGFMGAVIQMSIANSADIILAEPVGSYADLSAALFQPIKDKWKHLLTLGPLSVLIDPVRLRGLLDTRNRGPYHRTSYILQKQMEEADFIVINKIDLLSKAELNYLMDRTSKKWPQAKVFGVSALTGENMDEWINEVLASEEAGLHSAELDHDLYTEEEASLGWLNASILLKGTSVDWKYLIWNFLSLLYRRLLQRGIAVGHIKCILQNNSGYLTGNITGTSRGVSLQGELTADDHAMLLFNARVQMPPEELEPLVFDTLQRICNTSIEYDILAQKCLKPGPPITVHNNIEHDNFDH